jgi:Rv0078B-related antitoxin
VVTVSAGRRLDWRRIEVVDPDVAAALRAKSGAERLRLAHEAWELARHRLVAFLGWRHPDWTNEQVAREVAKRLANDRS